MSSNKKTLFRIVIATAVPASTIVVNTTEFLLAADDDGVCTMHEAVAAANDNLASGVSAGECAAEVVIPSIDIIQFDAVILPAHINLANPLELSEYVEVRGPGSELLSITNQLGRPVFFIQNIPAFVEFEISDMALINTVLDPNIDTGGGAIFALISADTQLTLIRMLFDSNHADEGGGATSLIGLPSANNRIIIRSSLESQLKTLHF